MSRLFAISCLLCLALLGAGSPAASEPLASADANWDGIKVHLMTVERKGSVLSVKWAVTNEGEGKTRVFFVFTGNDPCYVIDEENGVKYYALTDKEGNAIASGNEYVSSGRAGVATDVPSGSTRRYWMKMPAPPPEVKEISVFLSETEPFDGVVIADK